VGTYSRIEKQESLTFFLFFHISDHRFHLRASSYIHIIKSICITLIGSNILLYTTLHIYRHIPDPGLLSLVYSYRMKLRARGEKRPLVQAVSPESSSPKKRDKKTDALMALNLTAPAPLSEVLSPGPKHAQLQPPKYLHLTVSTGARRLTETEYYFNVSRGIRSETTFLSSSKEMFQDTLTYTDIISFVTACLLKFGKEISPEDCFLMRCQTDKALLPGDTSKNPQQYVKLDRFDNKNWSTDFDDCYLSLAVVRKVSCVLFIFQSSSFF
jgi:hypothetical protein